MSALTPPLPFRLIPHRHSPGAELQPAHVKSTGFNNPANSVGPGPASLGCTMSSYSSIRTRTGSTHRLKPSLKDARSGQQPPLRDNFLTVWLACWRRVRWRTSEWHALSRARAFRALPRHTSSLRRPSSAASSSSRSRTTATVRLSARPPRRHCSSGRHERQTGREASGGEGRIPVSRLQLLRCVTKCRDEPPVGLPHGFPGGPGCRMDEWRR